MASTVIHMAIASEVNKTLKRNESEFLIGSIAPDISKLLGKNKVESHFLENETNDVPDIDRFIIKYKEYLDDDFVLGYFVHLYTDYLWFKYFVPEFYENDYITKLDGTKVKCTGKMFNQYIYNDYTNLNIQLINKYNMDLSIFYNDPPKFRNIIKEIPMDRIKLIIDKASIIIKNSKVSKDLIINIENIENFIELCIELTFAKLKELNVI